MAAQRSAYSFSYSTMSGTDIKCVFAGTTIGEAQAVSIQVTREKTGIYTLGSPSPRSFSRGKRGIAGSIIMIQFDRDPLIYNLRNLKFQADSDELFPDYTDTSAVLGASLSSFSGRTEADAVGVGMLGNPNVQTSAQIAQLSTAISDQVIANPWYADQVPPFDITLVGANEYGDVMKASILGVELLNEGWGVSVDDMVMEKQYTYVARDVKWWTYVDNSTNVQALRST